MQKHVNIEIPPEISFLDLGLRQSDDGTTTYNMEVFKSMLAHNNISITEITQDDIESLLAIWYIHHRKNDGAPDMVAERFFEAVSDQPQFEPRIHWNSIIQPPTPEQIKEVRWHVGMKQREMASLLDLSNRQLISDYEKGKKSPNPQTWTLWLLLTGQHPSLKVIKR